MVMQLGGQIYSAKLRPGLDPEGRGSLTCFVFPETDSCRYIDDTSSQIKPKKKSRKHTASWKGNAKNKFLMPTINSLCNPVISLDFHMQQVLTYFTNAWMPSPDSIPARCQLTTMTPLRPGDDQIAFGVLQSTFQNSDATSLYALLAAGARRMQAVHKNGMHELPLADAYSVRAIQGIRKAIDNGGHLSARTALDLMFLLFSEFLAPSPAQCEVYWHLLRSVIISSGGLQVMPVFIAQIAIVLDCWMCAGALTKPRLDLFNSPELILSNQNLQSQQRPLDNSFKTSIWNLDERLQILAIHAHSLTILIDDMQKLPNQALDQTRKHVSKQITRLYSSFCEPLWWTGPGKYTQNSPQLIEADTLYLHVKYTTWRQWVTYCALSYVSAREAVQIPDVDPLGVMGDLSRAWEVIVQIRQMLQGSGWMMPPGVLLWVAAVYYLTCDDSIAKERYRELLRIEAYELRISSLSQLRCIMQLYLSLELIEASFDTILWAAIKG